MLAIFVVCSCSNAMHWIQFSIISNIATRYFDVSSSAINWTAAIFEACYIPFAFPASWLLGQYVRETHCVFREIWVLPPKNSQRLFCKEESFYIRVYNPLKTSGYTIFTTRFNTLKLCILPTQSICVFRMVLTINSDSFPKQH
jgi:hypothetical protein